MKIAVYTAITGKFNNKLRPPLKPVGPDVDLICFSDCLWQAPDPWRLLPPAWEHATNSRRTARYHKMMPHLVLPGYDYWIWMDGNQQLADDPKALVQTYLSDDVNFASYRHPQRRCVYEELEACVKLKKDDPSIMRGQVARYKDEGYPTLNGMIETTVVIRRHCAEVVKLNAAWWDEIRQGSLRDQLSLSYVLWKQRVRINYVKGQRDRPVHFKYHPHR